MLFFWASNEIGAIVHWLSKKRERKREKKGDMHGFLCTIQSKYLWRLIAIYGCVRTRFMTTSKHIKFGGKKFQNQITCLSFWVRTHSCSSSMYHKNKNVIVWPTKKKYDTSKCTKSNHFLQSCSYILFVCIRRLVSKIDWWRDKRKLFHKTALKLYISFACIAYVHAPAPYWLRSRKKNINNYSDLWD